MNGKQKQINSRYILVIFIIINIISLANAFAINSATKSIGVSADKPAEIEADSLHYDKNTSIATAEGNVEVTQGELVLVADKVIYDQANNTVTAEGHISLLEPDGNVFFAEKMTLKDDLKKGIINKLSAKFTDKSTMTADQAEKVNEEITILENASYSPCPVCNEDPSSSPLWQVTANKATIDEKEQKVSYNNAFFEIKGVPVLYTPYLSHPTPGADRKSGFLIPKYSSSKVFGTTVKLPYYINIAPNKDLTLTPIITANEGPILAGDYRHLLQSGSYTLQGSITNPHRIDANGNEISGNKVRGHVEGKGKFDLDDIWSWGFDGKRSSDDTYLKRYNFGEEDVLTSNAYANAISDRNFFHLETVTFQGLKATDDPGKTPLILPSATGHYESPIDENGAKWLTDANVLSLQRDEGISMNRVSVKHGFSIPYLTKSGNVFEFNGSVRGDGYSQNKNNTDSTDSDVTNTTTRLIPEAELKWSLPLVKQMANRQFFLEPIANFIISPNIGDPDKISNEDSQGIELSDENLFESNHFSGYDRIESGPRTNYGVRAKLVDPKNGEFGLLLGQTYHALDNNDLSDRSGFTENFSDYVGRVSYQKDDFFNAAYQFRLDSKSFEFNRNSVSAGIKFAPVKFDLDYVSVNDSSPLIATPSENGRDEIVIASASFDITDEWVISSSGNRNLDTGDWVSNKTSLIYKGDCIEIATEWLKEYTRDRDIVPNTTLSVQIHLKNFGY